MTTSNADRFAADKALALLMDYRERRQAFAVFSDYDRTMEERRSSATEKLEGMQEPLKSIASRLFGVTDKGFFLVQVCEWKLDYICDALMHAIRTKNPIALSINARALVEHLAALVAVVKELEKLHEKIKGQAQERTIHSALQKAEEFLNRAFYGQSPKVAEKKTEQAIHINECIRALKQEWPDVESAYDFLCEYVHPNYGSNALVSTGSLASGRLNPGEDFHREALNTIRNYCANCMLFLSDWGTERAAIFIKLQNLFNLCAVPGSKLSSVFAVRTAGPRGDGKSKETAYSFHKARTGPEAVELCYKFLADEGYEIRGRRLGGMENGAKYDVFDTDKGDVWVRFSTDLPL